MSGTAFELALAAHREGRLEHAAQGYREALAAEPDNVEALRLLGAALLELGHVEEAREAIERALALRPDEARYHNDLGVVLHRLGRYEAARTAFESALARMPDYADAYANLGALLFDRGRYEEAALILRKALIYAPDHIGAGNNLGRALLRLDRTEEAIGMFEAVLHFRPDNAEALTNLGVALNLLGDHAGARAAFEKAIALQPQQVEAHVNYAQTLLLEGKYEQGWQEHEWRLRRRDYRHDFTAPRWQGEDIAEQTILLWAEQGLGDAIQFIRYAPMVAARAKRVVVECHPALHRLFHGVEGVAEVVAQGEGRDYDVHAPLMSLPLIFGTRGDTIPARIPYLPVPLAMELGPAAGRRVGLVWAGNPEHARDRYRSRPLAAFAPLARVSRVSFYALQFGPAAAEKPPAGMTLVDLTPRIDDFYDTAAALAALDLLISVDTAPAHLAGALGRPVWVLLPRTPDWRWRKSGTTTPWYPTMRLFREEGGWAATFERLAAELARFRC